MWVTGIMQGLMWREYDDQGFLVNSFAEPWRRCSPTTCVRGIGGLMYLAGGLIMAWNVWMTIRGYERDEAPQPGSRTCRAAGRIRRVKQCHS
jgi:cytochrome c oxidase cbb3-type subunit 1